MVRHCLIGHLSPNTQVVVSTTVDSVFVADFDPVNEIHTREMRLQAYYLYQVFSARAHVTHPSSLGTRLQEDLAPRSWFLVAV